MNKSQIREFLGNLKAAVRLGHSDAVGIAFDNLRSFPEVAANDHLSDGHLDQLIRPAGDIVSRLSADQLLHLVEDPLTTLRAIGAVALAKRFFIRKDVNQSNLQLSGKDPRPEVRTALGETIREVGEAYPEHLLQLLESWLGDPSPKIRATTLIAIPALAPSQGENVISLLEPLKNDEDRHVRLALVNALQAIAQRDLAEPILNLLTDWSTDKHPNVWVITRTLSGSWAASHPHQAAAIIKILYTKVGETKNITNALRALERHGATIEIDQ